MSLVGEAIARARMQRAQGDLMGAAATLDAEAPNDRERVLPLLREILDALTVREHGLVFRFIPAGSFIMGSASGEPDESPAHKVRLPGFWISEAPLSWSDFTRILGWPEPPEHPTDGQLERVAEVFGGPGGVRFRYLNDSEMRLQYCENDTLHARDWHAHAETATWFSKDGEPRTTEEMFGKVQRASTEPFRFNQKPMVAVSWELAELMGCIMSTPALQYRLPTEAEWERAARGCFRGAHWPWGDGPPDASRADFDRFRDFSLRPSRAFPPNDYQLFSMAGGVWEWCADHYDASFYLRSPEDSPRCMLPEDIPERAHVLRGGSWADCGDTLRVSFRSASTHGGSPNVGFRLVRVTVFG